MNIYGQGPESGENPLPVTAKSDKLVVKDGWISCPVCGRNHRLLRITDETEACGLPVYCRTCRSEIILNIAKGQSVKRQSQ
ncbi:cysteine-rich KTR domain-containing protein [Oscillibacter ruminantium]|uniref:cysteine-rich KTR domain-containing protein n=1 Tax=Oscillibacter ruminantium TaxID=1263547 RepID=UPI0009D9AC63|nr:cysteine-rich KTR domain-containing protein [Oscillibacter ruminantium]